MRNLILWPGYSHYITRHFGTWKVDLAIPFLLKLFDFAHASNEFSMVQAVDDDGLRDKLCVLQDTTDKLDWCGDS